MLAPAKARASRDSSPRAVKASGAGSCSSTGSGSWGAVMICRSASAAASPSHFGGLRGGSSVALRIASRAVDASHQSALPLRRASRPAPARSPTFGLYAHAPSSARSAERDAVHLHLRRSSGRRMDWWLRLARSRRAAVLEESVVVAAAGTALMPPNWPPRAQLLTALMPGCPARGRRGQTST